MWVLKQTIGPQAGSAATGPSEGPDEFLGEESGDREGGPLSPPLLGIPSKAQGWEGSC